MENLSKEKQIEEMAKDLAFNICWDEDEIPTINCLETATRLFIKGYRKQNENTVELPCKVGDILYVISRMKDKRILPFINEYAVTSIGIKRKSIVIYHEMDGYIKSFKQTDFGRTIFLTKEEAEAKMKGGGE